MEKDVDGESEEVSRWLYSQACHHHHRRAQQTYEVGLDTVCVCPLLPSRVGY